VIIGIGWLSEPLQKKLYYIGPVKQLILIIDPIIRIG
jgi:hypothetical protein